MKKISRNDAIKLIVDSSKNIVMSLAFWEEEFSSEKTESEVFECVRNKLIESGPIDSEGSFVGFFTVEASMKEHNLIQRFLYAYGNYKTKLIVANPSDEFIKNIPPMVLKKLNEIGEFDEEVIEEAKKIKGCDWFFLNDGNEYDEPIYFYEVNQKFESL